MGDACIGRKILLQRILLCSRWEFWADQKGKAKGLDHFAEGTFSCDMLYFEFIFLEVLLTGGYGARSMTTVPNTIVG
jgi:hypothetical protein